MARSRTPLSRALTAGAHLRHPERFRDRRAPARTRPLGDPYQSMTPAQCRYWREFAAELPWLHSAHRTLLRMTCVLAARMDEDDGLALTGVRTLSSLLSKLGATPADESRVTVQIENDDDDDFFSPAKKFLR